MTLTMTMERHYPARKRASHAKKSTHGCHTGQEGVQPQRLNCGVSDTGEAMLQPYAPRWTISEPQNRLSPLSDNI
jgi:hypothetical protein